MAPRLEGSTICFIGGGNMAAAIIGGLAAKGIQKQQICVSEPWNVNREKMDALGVRTTTSNAEAARDSDVLVFAVKPQVARGVCQELGAAWAGRDFLPVVVSIAAGITLASLAEWFMFSGGRTPHIVHRIVGCSGPAYFFAMIENLISSASALGLSEEQATRLAEKTCFGAGKMLVESPEDPAQLRRNVTSPNGTTDAALRSFEASGFQEMVDKAVKAATSRSKELGQSLAQS